MISLLLLAWVLFVLHFLVPLGVRVGWLVEIFLVLWETRNLVLQDRLVILRTWGRKVGHD